MKMKILSFVLEFYTDKKKNDYNAKKYNKKYKKDKI